MEQYSGLSRAQLSYDYLHTNSTTHEFLFGAVAELIDNSRDAGATELDIYTIADESLRGGYMLCFADNGCGMTTDETRNVVIFGKSIKRVDESISIGMYGNGLKSGSMRIGNDMILFTKKEGVYTCLFLSRTFHEEEKIDEVIVPLPAFKGSDKVPVADTPEDKKRHDIEMMLILRYSPFRCVKDLFAHFDKIKGPSGTIVIVYNMKLLDSGQPELDITSDPRDVILTHPDLGDHPDADLDVELCLERRSLRGYVSILYSDPRMKVYLQGRKVQTKRLVSTLFRPRMYNYASKTFRARAESEVAKAKEEVKIAELRAKEAESKARDLESRYSDPDPDQLKAIRKLREHACMLRELVKQKQNAAIRKQKALKDPKTVTFYFGINIENRACDGMFVYNCSRLIKMYQRIGPQQDSGMTCRGVVGIVNVPYLVLEPTHNKQDFADAKEFRALMRAMADHLMQYWDDLEMDKKGVDLFWTSFGYLSAKWRNPPSGEERFVRKRALNTSVCVQCDQCLKWRILPFQQSQVGKDVPDSWQCRDNPDPKHKRCSEPEQQLNIPVGVVKRKIKTKEQRQVELEEQIRKKQEELERMKDTSDGDIPPERNRKSSSGPGSRKRPASSEEEEEDEEEGSSEEEAKPRRSTPASTNSSNRGGRSGTVGPSPAKGGKSNQVVAPPPPSAKRGRPVAGALMPTRGGAAAAIAAARGGKNSAPSSGRRRVQAESSESGEEESSEHEEEEEDMDEKPAPQRARKPVPTPSQTQKRPPPPSPTDIGLTGKGQAQKEVGPPPVKRSAPSPVVKESPTPPSGTAPIPTAASNHQSPSKEPQQPVIRRLMAGTAESPAAVVAAPDPSSTATVVSSISSSPPLVISGEPAPTAPTEGAAAPVSGGHTGVKKEPNEMPDSSVTSADGQHQQANRIVDVRVGKQWLTGRVAETKDGKIRVKFDNMPEDIHDRWMPVGSPEVKVRSLPEPEKNNDEARAEQAPKDSEKILENFRVCLRYFLPPDWPVDKEKIHSLSDRELADFPLEKFFDRYEQGLRKLLSNFQMETSNYREKLIDLRRNISKLLIHIDKGMVITSTDGDVVDKLLQTYIAEQQQPPK